MSHYSFLTTLLELQNGVAFDRLIYHPTSTISYSAKDSSFYWNLALTDTLLNESEITEIEAAFKKLGRNATITFEDKTALTPLSQLLESKHYTKVFTDSWLFFKGDMQDNGTFSNVKHVTNEKDLAVFLEVFDTCYRKDDPQNPYGELGEYLISAKETWIKNKDSGRIAYYIVYDGSTPVAVSTLNSYQGVGYISNVGSIHAVRGKGFGKTATLYAVDQSQKLGNTITCLATEEGTYPHEFYTKIGFTKEFASLGYTKIIDKNV